jgi:hypothetical protein
MQQETKDPFRKSETELKSFLKEFFKKCFSFKWKSQYVILKLRCSANFCIDTLINAFRFKV